MKKFSFPLGRVMDFRATQARVEELKLEALYAEIRGIADCESRLMRERLEAEQGVLRGASGAEFRALDSFRRYSVAEHTRLEGLRADCSKRIAAQMQVVAAKRRDVRLLERLKDQRQREWTRELDREIDAQADEAFLAKLHRRA